MYIMELSLHMHVSMTVWE